MALTKSGELLKSARLNKKLTLEDVEEGTKIRVKFLAALEKGEFDAFHSIAYARGFLKNYAEFLGLDPQLILAVFRRETTAQYVKILPQGMVQSGSSWSRVTPTRAVILGVILILLSIGYYLFQEYRGFLGAPRLTLEKPKEQETVAVGEIDVVGKTDIDATVLVNGELAAVEENGRFTAKIEVFKGETTLTIVAKNRRGRETTVTRKITVE